MMYLFSPSASPLSYIFILHLLVQASTTLTEKSNKSINADNSHLSFPSFNSPPKSPLRGSFLGPGQGTVPFLSDVYVPSSVIISTPRKPLTVETDDTVEVSKKQYYKLNACMFKCEVQKQVHIATLSSNYPDQKYWEFQTSNNSLKDASSPNNIFTRHLDLCPDILDPHYLRSSLTQYQNIRHPCVSSPVTFKCKDRSADVIFLRPPKWCTLATFFEMNRSLFSDESTQVKTVALIMTKVMLACMWMHELDFVRLDISMENVLVVLSDKNEIENVKIENLFYMQLEGKAVRKAEFDPRKHYPKFQYVASKDADLWSLGMLLYRLVFPDHPHPVRGIDMYTPGSESPKKSRSSTESDTAADGLVIEIPHNQYFSETLRCLLTLNPHVDHLLPSLLQSEPFCDAYCPNQIFSSKQVN